MKPLAVAFLLPFACLMSGIAASGELLVPRNLEASVRVSLDASGKVTALEFLGKQGNDDPIARKLLPAIQTWSFAPGSVDGVPQPTDTTLNLVMRAQPQLDGSYALRILSAAVGVGSVAAMSPPAYPRAALENDVEGRFLVDISVGTDGVPDGVAIVAAKTTTGRDPKRFEKTIHDTALTWRFRPEVVGGHPVAAHVRSTLDFCLFERTPCQRLPEEDEAKAPDSTSSVDVDPRAKLLTAVTDIVLR
jgi:TonB family protein